MASSLEALSQKNTNVAVLKVEIAKWGSPVANQYKIHSIPYFQVYDASGKKTAEGDAAREQINRLMK